MFLSNDVHLLFQPTLPARGATPTFHSTLILTNYFNPRSPHGERRKRRGHHAAMQKDFNPRSPHGERPMIRWTRRKMRENFNPRSPHGERQKLAINWYYETKISTHAPRTGSDRPVPPGPRQAGYFNPRSPHGERQASFARVQHR